MLYQLSYRPFWRGKSMGLIHLNKPLPDLQLLPVPADLSFMDGMERRVHQRIAWRGLVRLLIPGGDPVEATISDISESGCGVRIERAIERGAEVGIDGVDFHGAGVVRFCYPHHGAFRAGIELRPPD
jgi:hypothetical protein